MPATQEKLECVFTPAFREAIRRVNAVRLAPGATEELVRAAFKKEMLALGPTERIENLYRIYDKKTGKYIQMKLKPAQRRFREERTGRDLILKSRQIGFTTHSVIEGFDHAIWEEGRVGIMAQDQATVHTIFEMVKIANEYFKREYGQLYPLEENKDNANELSWTNIKGKISVRYRFQGYTLTFLHISEAAFTDQDRIIFSLQAVPETGRIVLESTPNGPGGYFYNIYQSWKKDRGSAPFRGHFFPWFENYPENPEQWSANGHPLNLDAIEQDLVDSYKLEDYHILYRRFKLAELGGSTEEFEVQYPSDDVSCFLSNENAVYPQSILKTQQRYLCDPAFVGNLFTDGKVVRFSSDPKKGLVSIWDLPKPNKVYYGGADPSGGAGGDPGCAIVIDAHSGEQVAELHGFMDPDLFAEELFKLGQYYNQAFWCIESNNHGHAVILKLKGVYPNLYRRQQFDNITKRLSPVIGFYTTNSEKMAITDGHVAACRQGAFKIRSRKYFEECGTFVQLSGESGRTMHRQARADCHDDRVMAGCFAWEMKRARPLADFSNEQIDAIALRGLHRDPDTGFFMPDEDYSQGSASSIGSTSNPLGLPNTWNH